MSSNKIDIYVYADWKELGGAKLVGKLTAQISKGRRAFSFEYDDKWLASNANFILYPDLQLYSGRQFPNEKTNFGIFLDSMPDTWGRTLMKRRAAQLARDTVTTAPKLHDVDFLMGGFMILQGWALCVSKQTLQELFWIMMPISQLHHGPQSENCR